MGAFKDLASAVRETQLEMWGLMALPEKMNEKIDKAHRGEPATHQCSASYTAAAASSIDTTSRGRNGNGRGLRPRASRRSRGRYLPNTNLHQLSCTLCMQTWGPIPRNPYVPSTSATATGPAPRHGEPDEGWKKVERKRKGKGKEKKGVEGASRPRLTKLGVGASKLCSRWEQRRQAAQGTQPQEVGGGGGGGEARREEKEGARARK